MQRTSLKKGNFDWPAVHMRLRATERAITEALAPNAQRMEAAYRGRAAKLAQAETDNFSVPVGLPVLVFHLGQERYAIELKNLAEVLPCGYCAPVPRSPVQFMGMISVRGELRAVVDLRRVLTPASEGPDSAGSILPGSILPGFSSPGFILMLRAGNGVEQIGLKVDSIEELGEIRPGDSKLGDIKPGELTPGSVGSCLAGMASGSLPLLNVTAVLARVLRNHPSSGESSTK